MRWGLRLLGAMSLEPEPSVSANLDFRRIPLGGDGLGVGRPLLAVGGGGGEARGVASLPGVLDRVDDVRLIAPVSAIFPRTKCTVFGEGERCILLSL
mmetsp:Transcript_30244/g.44484  ORF Transcript_30244/g.44484 Transcript_30244/m.44484 type:complete len:97 (-) Transcript_30244:833-1123(-)